MAARLNPKQDERSRDAIKTTQLVKRLQDFASEAPGVEIDNNRLKAIEILLRKTLPDLKQIEHSGETTMRVVSEAPLTADEWKSQHSNED